MSEQSQFMLVFSLGPVQSFIQQARKTRDLWMGSLLFSKLMEAAMREIEGEFIFPTKRTVEEIPDIPNKYIAVFDDLSQAQHAAAQSQQQIKTQWQQICNKVWQEIIAGQRSNETLNIWLRQTGVDPNNPNADQVKLDALFEIYWAIVDRKEDQTYENYSDWFATAESRLAARKRLRDFKAKEEPGEKSAISGEREVLHGSGTHSSEIQQFWKSVATARSHSPKDIDQEGKEHLDAIDTIKRFSMEAKVIIINGKPFQKPFPSTSSVATASFVEQLIRSTIKPTDELKDALKSWYGVTNKQLRSNARDTTQGIPYLERKANSSDYQWILQCDGDLYFAETFVPRRLKENYGIPLTFEGENLAKRGNTVLRALLHATDALKITRPTPYYAVIQMDGDKMGILLSGVKDEREHREISKALSSFARETAVDLVEKQYPAKLVYAGGDDVLAFAPLARDTMETGQPRHVLDLVDRLQKRYQETIREALPQPRDEKRVKEITASTGIVIAHHYTSLAYVLRSAREAEDSAKKRYGKDALVVTLIRRSGEQTRVGCHWRYSHLADDDPGQPIALFSRFYRLFQEDVLSPKCVHILLEEAPALVNMKIEEAQDPMHSSSAMQSEIKRILKRQRDPRRKAAFDDNEVHTYAWYLTRLAAAMDDEYPQQADGQLKSVELHADYRRYGLVEVLGWLLVMAFLARKEQE